MSFFFYFLALPKRNSWLPTYLKLFFSFHIGYSFSSLLNYFWNKSILLKKLITINLLLFSIWHTIAREKQKEKFFVGLGQGVWLMSYWKLFAKINPSLYTTPRENLILLRRAVYYQNVHSISPYNVLFSGFKSAINIRQMYFMIPLKTTSRCERIP